MLAAGVYNAVVIYREIQTLGYTGKIRVLRSYIEPKRALRASKATVRFETKSGHQLQHGWGEIFSDPVLAIEANRTNGGTPTTTLGCESSRPEPHSRSLDCLLVTSSQTSANKFP